MRCLLKILDGFGVYGYYFHFGMVIAFVGSAFLAFLYFWKTGKLDMDEEPKLQMMRDDELKEEENHE